MKLFELTRLHRFNYIKTYKLVAAERAKRVELEAERAKNKKLETERNIAAAAMKLFELTRLHRFNYIKTYKLFAAERKADEERRQKKAAAAAELATKHNNGIRNEIASDSK